MASEASNRKFESCAGHQREVEWSTKAGGFGFGPAFRLKYEVEILRLRNQAGAREVHYNQFRHNGGFSDPRW